MRITLMGELGDEQFELIWDDGALRGTPRLVRRFADAARDAGEDAVAFLAAVEQGLPARPNLVVWPEADVPAGDPAVDPPSTAAPRTRLGPAAEGGAEPSDR